MRLALGHLAAHLFAAEQVKMHMVHRLARVVPAVCHEAPPAFRNAPFFGNIFGDKYGVSEKLGVFLLDLVKAIDMNLWHYQQVCGGLGIDVHEHDQLVVFMHMFCRKLFVDDFAKNAVFSHWHLLIL
jgi:hypothetical protein